MSRSIPDYGDHMTLKKFIKHCKAGYLINYDGTGYYATSKKVTDIVIYPSDVTKGRMLEAYSHVMWFNR